MNAKNPPYTAQSCREEAAINDKFGDPIMNDPDLLRAHADALEELAALREQLAERENWDRLRGEEARRLANEIAEARRTRDVVLSANVNITMERDQIREQLAERDAEIAALKGRLHEIAEEWAGAECGEPVTAQEGYAIGLCKRMYRLATYPKE